MRLGGGRTSAGGSSRSSSPCPWLASLDLAASQSASLRSDPHPWSPEWVGLPPPPPPPIFSALPSSQTDTKHGESPGHHPALLYTSSFNQLFHPNYWPRSSGSAAVAMTTTQPTNQSELNLYQVLQRANLLQYYDTFIQQGGDDVNQLCEAGEEEFLEIMALVGMASKPLHVRRLQKALQEYVANPAAFAASALPAFSTVSPIPGNILSSIHANTHNFSPSALPTQASWNTSPITVNLDNAPSPAPSALSTSPRNNNENSNEVVVIKPSSPWQADMANSEQNRPSPNLSPSQSFNVGEDGNSLDSMKLPKVPLYYFADSMLKSGNSSSGSSNGDEHERTSPQPQAQLTESQIEAIQISAHNVAAQLPYMSPKPMNLRKQIAQDVERVMQLPAADSNRMNEMRTYSAIYGRFDSKRKNVKPMSLHELSVNEAAAQLCFLVPALLTRREELFPLARQVVRDSGYQYAKGHSRAQSELPPAKRMKVEPDSPRKLKSLELNSPPKTPGQPPCGNKAKEEVRIAEITSELKRIDDKQNLIKAQLKEAAAGDNPNAMKSLSKELEHLSARHLSLITERSMLLWKQKKGGPARQNLQKSLSIENAGVRGMAEAVASSSGEGMDNVLQFRALNGDILRGSGLFEEGIRIAQQYGMADFAEELKELKHDADPEESQTQGDAATDKPLPSENVPESSQATNTDARTISSETVAMDTQEGNMLLDKSVTSSDNHTDAKDVNTNGMSHASSSTTSPSQSQELDVVANNKHPEEDPIHYSPGSDRGDQTLHSRVGASRRKPAVVCFTSQVDQCDSALS